MFCYNIGSIYAIQHFIPIQEDKNLEFLGRASVVSAGVVSWREVRAAQGGAEC